MSEPTKHIIEGTPFEVGAELFTRFIMPALKVTAGRPQMEVQQLYAGIITACLGAMAADFGTGQAADILRTMADAVDRMSDDLDGAAPH